jgi:hypothetical protein
VFFSVLILSSCSTNTNGTVVFDPPHCKITRQSNFKASSPGNFSSIAFTIENDGNGNAAYHVGVAVKLKNGNVIVDEGFASISSLEKGESIVENVTFVKVNSASEYNTVAVRLYWYDYDNGYYESNL